MRYYCLFLVFGRCGIRLSTEGISRQHICHKRDYSRKKGALEVHAEANYLQDWLSLGGALSGIKIVAHQLVSLVSLQRDIRIHMIDNILIRALLAVVVAFILMKYLLPLFLIPNPINWILTLIILITLLFWVIRGNAGFTGL